MDSVLSLNVAINIHLHFGLELQQVLGVQLRLQYMPQHKIFVVSADYSARHRGVRACLIIYMYMRCTQQ
jgi:hypothetical protein